MGSEAKVEDQGQWYLRSACHQQPDGSQRHRNSGRSRLCSRMCAGKGGQGRSSIHSRLWADSRGQGGHPTGRVEVTWKPAPSTPGIRGDWMGRGNQEPKRDREGPRQGKEEAKRPEAGEKVSKNVGGKPETEGHGHSKGQEKRGPRLRGTETRAEEMESHLDKKAGRQSNPEKVDLGQSKAGRGKVGSGGWGWEEAGLRQVGTAQRNQRGVMATSPRLPMQAWLKASC